MNASIRRGGLARRKILSRAVTLGIASLIGVHRLAPAAEPPPETKRIRLLRFPPQWGGVPCVSPMWLAEDLLRAEGFDEVTYLRLPESMGSDIDALAAGEADLTQTEVFSILPALDSGKPLVALGGIHGGCYELFAGMGVRSIRDLKGKTIATAGPGRRGFVSAMLAHVGLDPRKDVKFVESWDGVRLLAEGKVDATLGFPPEPQIMRARKIGASIVNTATDRPWSQYFCCMAVGNRDFVAKHPAATKRALRALVKAADICASEPERVARTLVERGFYTDYENSAQALKDVPYRRWREYDSADSLRFYALRLHEGGLIKSNPQKLLAQGTDWRFIEQLKKELKA
jgi:NitT/TauT family transport system substrate-binding protein